MPEIQAGNGSVKLEMPIADHRSSQGNGGSSVGGS